MDYKKFLILVLSVSFGLYGPVWAESDDEQEVDKQSHRSAIVEDHPEALAGFQEEARKYSSLHEMNALLDEADKNHFTAPPVFSHLHPEKVAHYFPRKGGAVRVLSLNGGGIRGLVEIMFLAEIEKITGKSIHELFDVVAATSTGAILAAALTVNKPGENRPYTAQEVVALYDIMGPAIFQRSKYDKLSHAGGLFGAQYTDYYRDAVFRKYFGESQLKDAQVHLVIPSYDLLSRKVVVFKTRHAKASDRDNYDTVDVLRATTSAPTYFPPAVVKSHGEDPNEIHAIDGGVCANNPGLFGYVEARRLYPGIRDTLLVSLGTGSSNKSIPVDKAQGWGNLQWMRPIIDCMMVGQNDSTHYLLDSRLNRGKPKQNYFRFDPHLDNASNDLDDVSPANIQRLKTDAKAMLDSRSREIEEVCERLIKGLGERDSFGVKEAFRTSQARLIIQGSEHPAVHFPRGARNDKQSVSRTHSPSRHSDAEKGFDTDDSDSDDNPHKVYHSDRIYRSAPGGGLRPPSVASGHSEF